MLAILIWWLIIEILGLIALPLALILFKNLPGRGYAFAQPLSLLLVSYTLWIAATFGFLRNSQAGIVFVIFLLALASAYIASRNREVLAGFWQKRWPLIINTEVIFTVAFLAYAFFRAHDPAIDHTEQPMDFGFINAILRSQRFPPHDQWLSGFAISYYYFGYLMIAILTKLSGLPSGITYNLALTLTFAWTVRGAFGLVYSLVQDYTNDKTGIGYGFLGAILVAVAGNLEGLLEFLHARGFGSEAFWRWVDIENLAKAPLSATWYPGHDWWWWRATRIIRDSNPLGKLPEVISEFPAFSFMLGDLHPHVMALPFGLIALALALNMLKGKQGNSSQVSGHDDEQPAIGFWPQIMSLFDGNSLSALLYPLCLGALGFLNSWDFPTYSFVTVAAYAVGRYRQDKARQDEGRPSNSNSASSDWQSDGRRITNTTWAKYFKEVVSFALWVGVLGFALYLPFYMGFRSQASGFEVLFYTKTKLHHYLLIYGLFLFVVVGFLTTQLKAFLTEEMDRERSGNLLTMMVYLFALALAAALAATLVLGVSGSVLVAALSVALTRPLVPLLIAILLSWNGAILWHELRLAAEETKHVGAGPGVHPHDSSLTFSLILIFTGLLLTYGTEFVFVRDSFGTRMNTVFKLYYQSWVFLAIASAFGVYWVVGREHRASQTEIGRYAWLGGFGVLLLISLYYPVAAFYTKAGGFANEPTLDGTSYLQRGRPAEYAAIRWLDEKVKGAPVIVEATGCEYCERSRVSAWTGLPTVLGWPGHERQWRGDNIEAGRREPDVAAIYQSPDLGKVKRLLDEYNVQYLYVGQLERETYQLNDSQIDRFNLVLDLIYDRDGIRIYKRRG